MGFSEERQLSTSERTNEVRQQQATAVRQQQATATATRRGLATVASATTTVYCVGRQQNATATATATTVTTTTTTTTATATATANTKSIVEDQLQRSYGYGKVSSEQQRRAEAYRSDGKSAVFALYLYSLPEQPPEQLPQRILTTEATKPTTTKSWLLQFTNERINSSLLRRGNMTCFWFLVQQF
ncbi:expressed unknown protein [Seminavis robusta]|uniref:Uncharacterized protein n=1 Tax=Seminavis robusta TaxID=568900 RepID=A0A9N8DHV5_9STRA|nr:expressed unknown protein [Seminavis robusta]|eukprot:Sro129_g061611.1  (185) ;mRNA; r:72094-72648